MITPNGQKVVSISIYGHSISALRFVGLVVSPSKDTLHLFLYIISTLLSVSPTIKTAPLFQGYFLSLSMKVSLREINCHVISLGVSTFSIGRCLVMIS